MGDAADKADPLTGSAPEPAFGTQSSYYKDAAALYADPKIRLHYPAELFERVYAFAGGPFSAALDVGTGTGQCAQQLASRYEQVNSVYTLLLQRFCNQSACKHFGCFRDLLQTHSVPLMELLDFILFLTNAESHANGGMES